MDTVLDRIITFIKHKGSHIRIEYKDILYVEAAENYAKLYTVDGMYLTLVSINQWHRELPGNQFCKIHRSFIVSLSRMRSFNKTTVSVGDFIIPLGVTYKKQLIEKVKIIQKIDCTVELPGDDLRVIPN